MKKANILLSLILIISIKTLLSQTGDIYLDAGNTFEQSASRYLSMGDFELANEKFYKALSAYNDGIQYYTFHQRPCDYLIERRDILLKFMNDTSYLITEAEFYYNKGCMYDGAVRTFSILIDSFPNDCNYRLKRGISYLELNKNNLAISDLSIVIKLCPSNQDSYLYRSIAYYNKGNGDTALIDLNIFIKSNPNSSKGYLAKGKISQSMNIIEEAINNYKVAIEKDSCEIEAYLQLGELYVRKKDFENAIKVYSKLDDIHDCILSNYFNSKYSSNPNNDNILKYRKKLDLCDSGEIHFLRGNCFYEINKYSEAIEDWKNAISFDKQKYKDKLKPKIKEAKSKI